MTLLSRLFNKFPKIQKNVQKIPGSEKYVNQEGLVIPQNLGVLLNEIADVLYTGAGGPSPDLEVEAVIAFDEGQRVDHFVSSTVNGQPKIPSFQTVEKISDLVSNKLKNAPANYKMKVLSVTVKGSNVKTQAQYFA